MHVFNLQAKTTCSAVWNRVEGELVARGVVHPQIFGLAIKTGNWREKKVEMDKKKFRGWDYYYFLRLLV